MHRGEKYLAAQNYQKAAIEFQNVLQIDPKDARARYTLGTVDEKLGLLTQAVQSYQNAIQLAPQQDYLDATIALGRLMVTHGASDRAMVLVKTALQKHPDQPDLLVIRAVARMQQKDVAGAAADAEHAAQLAPGNENAIGALAGIYKAQGNTVKAQALVERALQTLPNSADLHFMLAQIYADTGRNADAEAQLKRIIELRPKQSSDRIRLAQFYVRVNKPEAAETTMRRAMTDFPSDAALKLSLVDLLGTRHGVAAAAEELKKMVAADPKDIELQFALAKLYARSGEMPKAEALFRGVIQQKGTDPAGLQARDQLAALRLEQNDATGALTLINEVLAQNPNDGDSLTLRGNIELQHNDAKSAVVDLRAVLRDHPNNVVVLRALVRAHLANGEPLIAEEVMRQAVESNPADITLKSDLANLLVRLGKTDDAYSVIDSALKQAPGNLEALDSQFRIAMTTQDLPRARAAADAMVAAQPKLPLGHMYQGTVAERQKRYDDAMTAYTAAANLQPNAAEPLEAVVRVLSAQNRLPEALKHLDDAAAKYPTDPLPFDIKGELLVQNGKYADAKEAFRQASARAPTWWPPYRGTAKAQLLDKENLATIVEGLRHAKGVVIQTEQLSGAVADLLVREGKQDEAIAEYEESLRKYPNSDTTANNLAMLLVTYRKDPVSLARARDLTARFANSSSLAYQDTYGWVLYKRGEASAAVPVFARIVAESPRAIIARYHLGMAQALAGDPAAARDNLTQVVQSGQEFPGLDDAKSALQRLSKPATDAQPRT